MGKARASKGAWVSMAVVASIAAGAAWGQEDESDNSEALGEIEVIGVTPTHGVGLPKRQVPANVQSATGEDIDESHSLDLTDYLSRNLGSVHINEATTNPLQPDVQYRGFTASPLLGLPQGLAVYQDGVRINEPFGDTVNFSLIPESAISSINLIPGSNPLFGLNALGGALSIETKTGFSHPGTEVEAFGGSFGRKVIRAETGGHNDAFSYFLTGEYFDEDGFRDFSDSQAGNLFGNLGWEDAKTTLNLSVSYGNTDLIGNGSAPAELLAQDRDAIFTRPDITESELVMVNLRGSRELNANTFLDGNVYYRRNDIDTLNGDDSDFEPCEQPENAGLLCAEGPGEEEAEGEEGEMADGGEGEEEEEVVMDANGDPVEASPAVIGATTNTSKTNQDGYGASLQTTFLNDLLERQNQLIVGAAVDASNVDFSSRTELGTLDDTRLAVGGGILDGGSFVGVGVDTLNVGVFFSDTLSLTEALSLTVSGRYNRTDIDLDDQLGSALNGDHTFERFNPAVGATYNFTPALGLYASYSEANRAPTPVELTCADADDPCRLPNAFLADPPLDDVVAKTVEGGVRGRWQGIDYDLAVFNTVNKDDIIFISAGTLASEGFFDNIGDTRRRGVELNLSGKLFERVQWFLNYTYLETEFRENFAVASANHPFADANNEIQVESGDRIPAVPKNILQAGANYEVLTGFTVGAQVRYNSDQFLRGDESNQLDPVDGFAVVNLLGDYQITDHLGVFARVNNLFNTDYESFGLLGEADEVLGDEFDSPRFLNPGAPISGFVGLRASF